MWVLIHTPWKVIGMRNGNKSLRIKNSKISKLVLLIFAFIYLSEAIEVLINYSDSIWYYAFGLNSSTEGHVQLSLFIIFLPIYIIFFYAHKLFLENKSSLVYIYNYNRVQYLKEHLIVITKYIVIGLSILFFIDVVINIIRNLVLITYFPSVAIQFQIQADEIRRMPFLAWKLDHPLVAIIIYSITTIIYTVLMSYIVILLALILKDLKDLFIISFGINLLFFISPIYPVGKSIQPFVEGSLAYILIGTLSIYAIEIIICIFLFKIYMRGRDYV